MKGERRIFGGQKLHISDGNIVLSGILSAENVRLLCFPGRKLKTFVKIFPLKVFIN